MVWFEARDYNSRQILPVPAKILPVEVPTALVMKHGVAVKILYLDLIQKLILKIFFFGCLCQFTDCIALFHEATFSTLINSFRNNSKFLTPETFKHGFNFFLPLKNLLCLQTLYMRRLTTFIFNKGFVLHWAWKQCITHLPAPCKLQMRCVCCDIYEELASMWWFGSQSAMDH